MQQKGYEGQGTLRDILYILFKHRYKMIVTFGATLLTVIVGSLLLAPVYQASSKILVKFGRENVYMPAVSGGGSSGPIVVDPSREEHINSAIDVLKGQNVIEATIRRIGVKNIYPQLNAQEDPSATRAALDQATLMFQKRLSVEGVKKSNIIDIAFEHSSPIVAAKVVNALIDTFVEHHVAAYRQPRNYDFFSEQVKILAAKLKASETELDAFRGRHDLSSLQEQKTTLLRQIADVDVDLAKTRADLSENRGKKQALEASQGSLTTEARLGRETDANNPYALSAIRTRLTELRLKEAELLNRYPETSTFVTNVRREIEQAQQILAKEERTYHDKEVRSIDHSIQALGQKEMTLKETVGILQGRLTNIAGVETRFKALERQFKLDEENYQLYVRKMEESRISNAMDTEKMVNLSVLGPASVPVSPVRPKIWLNIILGIVVGALLSVSVTVLVEHLSHTFGRAEDVEKRLGVSVLASIREMEA